MRINKAAYLVLIFFLLISCKKDKNDNPDGSYQQWALALNYTATWCSYCGSWGAPLMHDLYKYENVLCISVHTNGDPMYTKMYPNFNDDRETGDGIPTFWIGDIKTDNVPESHQATQQLLERDPLAGLHIDYSRTDSILDVTIDIVFYENINGEFFLSTYLLEDGIDGSSLAGGYTQSGTSESYPNDDYMHDYVLRASTTLNDPFGEKITEDPTSNQTISKTYSFTIKEEWEKEVYPAAVLWKYDPNGSKPYYKYINAIK